MAARYTYKQAVTRIQGPFKWRVGLTAALTLAAAACMPVPARAQGGFNGAGPLRNQQCQIRQSDRPGSQQPDQRHPVRGAQHRQPAMGHRARRAWILVLPQCHERRRAGGDRTRGNSTPVAGRPFTGSPSQQWRIAPANDGNALITNRLGKTLDIPNASTRDGARVQTYDLNGGANQRFIFRRLADLARQ